MKIIIQNRNYFRFLVQMVEQLSNWPDVELHILDALSTWEPLVEWYRRQTLATVHYLPTNQHKHRAAWRLGFVERLVPAHSYYVVTDPDLDFSQTPGHLLNYLQQGFERYPDVIKCGPSLRIDDIPRGAPLYADVQQWEGGYWDKSRLTPCGCFFRSPIDTTFALYHHDRPTKPCTREPALRAHSMVRHLPWYLNEATATAEDRHRIANSETGLTGARMLERIAERKKVAV